MDIGGYDGDSYSEIKNKKQKLTKKWRYFTSVIIVARLSQLSDLKKHMVISTGKKRNNCNVCGKSFYENENLTKHMRTHTGEKPFPCSQCDQSFTWSDNLVSHMMTHTGEKPYECHLSHNVAVL